MFPSILAAERYFKEMRTCLRLCFLGMFTLAGLSAQQIATVTSTAPFTVRGASVNPTQGVPTFPVMAGDTIQAGNAPTVVAFPDGSVVTLDPNSQGRVEVINGRPVFRLTSGRATYTLTTLTSVGLSELNNAVTPAQLIGVLQIGNQQSGGGFWTTPEVTIAALGAAGLAAGLGVGLTRGASGGPPVSPIQ